ncbi:BrnA antitoxin family protein [Bosea sp. R86505]|uniref:BrnA antitoxin family protein n=1 Tax=Bosea sp. R86505 TaxID=3101710 RepID=UPI0036725CB6
MKKRYEQEPTIDELAATPESEIDYSDIPELGDAFWKRARVVEPDLTRPVTLRVKQSVLDAYKATGKGYQTRMNAVLETYAHAVLKPRS